ncbi:MAG: hypothetical protein OEZ06_14130 [Myxococcales bacterium]|nr:hypothetical protein [Myxococcales bacterium]
MDRPYAYAVSLALVAAVAYPVLLDPDDDSFPLSTYPMFSRPKPDSAVVTSAVALGPGGFERAVEPSYVANSEAMQALQTIRKSVQAGPASAKRLCERIAERIDDAGDAALAQAREVALVSRRYESIRFLAGERVALSERFHVRCPLRRGTP